MSILIYLFIGFVIWLIDRAHTCARWGPANADNGIRWFLGVVVLWPGFLICMLINLLFPI